MLRYKRPEQVQVQTQQNDVAKIESSLEMPFDDGFVPEKQETVPAAAVVPVAVLTKTSEPSASIIVETDYKTKKFVFYDSNKILLGSFTVKELIKFVTHSISASFLEEINHEIAAPIIEKYVCKLDKTTIIMLNHVESPFMANLETALKLYNFLNEFGETELEQNLSRLSEDERHGTESIFDDLIYAYSFNMLRIIHILLYSSNQPTDNSNIKSSMVQYSRDIMLKMSSIVKRHVDRKIKEIDTIKNELISTAAKKCALSDQADAIQRSLDKQNAQFDILLRQLVSPVQTNPVQFSEKYDSRVSTQSAQSTLDLADSLSEIISLRNDPASPQNNYEPMIGKQPIKYLSDVLVIE